MEGPEQGAGGRPRPNHVETLRARFSDTDAMGMAHHTSYVLWLEEARLGFLRAIGIPYSKLEARGLHLPVLECNCKFLAPVLSEDVVAVHLWIKYLTRARMSLDYQIWLTATGTLAAVARTEHVFTRDDGRATRLQAGSEIWRALSVGADPAQKHGT